MKQSRIPIFGHSSFKILVTRNSYSTRELFFFGITTFSAVRLSFAQTLESKGNMISLEVVAFHTPWVFSSSACSHDQLDCWFFTRAGVSPKTTCLVCEKKGGERQRHVRACVGTYLLVSYSTPSCQQHDRQLQESGLHVQRIPQTPSSTPTPPQDRF